jgi:prevent-host-death family protein
MKELTTDQKGAVAELAIATEASRHGIGVLRPLNDGHRYDLVFDLDGRLLRVQCKWAQRQGEVVIVRARTSRRTADGFKRGTYSPEEIDFVAAYCAELNCCYAVPIRHFEPCGQMHLRISPPLNGQRAGLHFADQYTLGAIAQLEERRYGIPEAVGSSPTSSTPSDADSATVGAHEFRNRFGWYMERAAAGEEILVTHRGRPRIRVAPAEPRLFAVAA